MNCKQGDLAVIVSANRSPTNVGKIVRCVRLLQDGELVNGVHWTRTIDGPVWLVEGNKLDWQHNGTVSQRAFSDVCLRPIRPQPDDAVDEVIQRIGTPHKEVA